MLFRYIFLLLFIFAADSMLHSQPGSIDTTFNPIDLGFGAGDGPNSGGIRSIIIQPDGKMIIRGVFYAFNGMPRVHIVRLNSNGSIDNSFINGNAGSFINTSALQPDGKILIGGQFTTYLSSTRNCIARLNADGTLDAGFDPGQGANYPVHAIALQSDGKIIIGGIFSSYQGIARNRIARINSDGSLDTEFNPGTGANDIVSTIVVQPDGKILIGGMFTNYNGSVRNRIARLNPDGSLDNEFNIGVGFNNTVKDIILQSDAKIFVSGDFTTYDFITRNRIVRLNADGSPDYEFISGQGANGRVNSVSLQADGKIVIGGNFTLYNNSVCNRIARLNPDGSLDTSFLIGEGANKEVFSIAIQPTGRMLIGGNFTIFNNIVRKNLARLDAGGSLDTNFHSSAGANEMISVIMLQPDSRILIGGHFTGYNGVMRNKIARLNADGSLDMSFQSGTGVDGSNSFVSSIAMQPDGKILIAGEFSSFNGAPRKGIARLNPDGSLDGSFQPGTGISTSIFAMTLQPDGKIMIGGDFLNYNGIPCNHIARLNADGTLDFSFNSLAGPNNSITDIVMEPNGKIIIGGVFTSYNGITRNRIARLNSDGSLDAGFNPGAGFDNVVSTIILQPDGKILVGGYTNNNDPGLQYFERFNIDGTLDAEFDSGTGPNGSIGAIVLQPDGKILIAGGFSSYNGIGQKRIARLNNDGSLDTTFDPGTGPDTGISDIVFQPDGKILIGGAFRSYNSVGRNRIARLKSDFAGNKCPDANNIDVLFQGALHVPSVSGVWENTHYISFDSDPTIHCWEENSVNTSIWYRFTGTGNTYRIQTVPCNTTNYIGTQQDNAGDTQMAVYWGNGCGNLTQVACNDNFFSDVNPDRRAGVELATEAGQQYYMLIDGFNNEGIVALGQFCVEVMQLTPNRVANIPDSEPFIFPNPTADRIQLRKIQPVWVEIYDCTGHLLQRWIRPDTELDISALPTGVYFLKIAEDHVVYSARIVKR